MTAMPKLLLLDGHSLAYRAFFALPTDLATKSGTVTNAVYGFTSMLTKVMADEQPDHIAVAFDAPGGSTYRNELDSEYKAGRKETPDLFRSQIPLIHEVLEALEITQLEITGVEADDVIATLATQAAAAGHRRCHRHRRPRLVPTRRSIRTSRFSTTSAASPTTSSTTKPASRSGASASLPRSTSTTRACAATPATTSPGVPGIGEKTAAKLITTYGGLEGVYDHLDELPPKQRTNLGEAKDRVFKNREMSRLTRDVDLDGVTPGGLQQGAFDRERVRVLFNQLEFRLLLPRILDAVGDVAETPESEYARGRRLDRPRRGGCRRGVARRVRATATGSRWRRAGRARSDAARSPALRSRPARTPRTSTVTCSTDPRCSDALGAIDGPESPPLVVHRAKELMQGLWLRARIARPRHRGHGVSARSRAKGNTNSKTSRCATSRSS